MKERLLEMKMCDEQIRISSTGSSVWVSHNTSNILDHEQVVATYVQLYSQARLDTLDALDRMLELRQAEELKSKLLFSIIVLSFRSVTKTVSELRQKVYTVLQTKIFQIPLSSGPS